MARWDYFLATFAGFQAGELRLVICTGKAAREDQLLFGELESIAQVIQNHLEQKVFEKTSLFPVYCEKSLQDHNKC